MSFVFRRNVTNKCRLRVLRVNPTVCIDRRRFCEESGVRGVTGHKLGKNYWKEKVGSL
eukprot:UN16711